MLLCWLETSSPVGSDSKLECFRAVLCLQLFDTAFNTVCQRVSAQLSDIGCKYSDSKDIKLVLGYADDICSMTSLASHNPAVVIVIQEWLAWS